MVPVAFGLRGSKKPDILFSVFLALFYYTVTAPVVINPLGARNTLAIFFLRLTRIEREHV
jgi:hypothetical protein